MQTGIIATSYCTRRYPQSTSKALCFLTWRGCTHRHPTGSSGGFAQRIHPLLAQRNSELVAAGITDTSEVRRSLRFYITNTLCQELGYQPKQCDRALYPTTTDIHNHVYSAKKAPELSKLDQENSRLKIDKWQAANPEASYFFDLLFFKVSVTRIIQRKEHSACQNNRKACIE